MSVSEIPVIMQRIEAATTKSPIAVFAQPKADSKWLELNAVFASTLRNAMMIEDSSSLVGVFHREDESSNVLKKLYKAVEK